MRGVLVWLVAGCGIPEDTPLVELSDKDREQLCDRSIAAFEETEVTCDGQEVTLEAVSLTECIDNLSSVSADCTATVEQWSGCSDDVVEDPCAALAGDLTPSCTAWVACIE